jgi:amino-acid N-acetyltransferase
VNEHLKNKAIIRKARISDVKEMLSLVNRFADQGEMLHRSINELYENLRDFFVLEIEGKFRGMAALHVVWEDLAEIKALVVDETAQNQGWGKKLVNICLEEARHLEIKKVFCLTFKPEFFEKIGFTKIRKSRLPQKIWSECVNCPKFTECQEIALIYEFNGKTSNHD